jgi:hypothetical protein
MTIDWDISRPPVPTRRVRFAKWLKRLLINTNVPLCHSDHYNADHFKDGSK